MNVRCAFVQMIAVLVMVLAAAGCATRPPVVTGEPVESRAAYALDVVVRAGNEHTVPLDAVSRPGRFVVLHDGSLLYDPDHGPAGVRVPWVRNLSMADREHLWDTVEAVGTAEGGVDSSASANLELESGQRSYTLTVRRGNQRWQKMMLVGESETLPGTWQVMMDMLTQLAWVRNAHDTRTISLPGRYDFGPDPYARYRNR